MARKRKKGTDSKQAAGGNGRARRTLDLSALEQWLWAAACTIRGPVDAPKYKNYILPLVFLKRLSDVFDDEVARLAVEFGDEEVAAQLVEQDHKLVRFYIPEKARWSRLATVTTKLGQRLTDAVRAVSRSNPRLAGVIDVTDFNAQTAGQPIVDNARLVSLVNVLSDSRYRLGLDDVEPDLLGRSYEFLLRKFAEGQGQSGGEQFTPTEVGIVMARVLDPQPGESVYDPCCGSGGLLIKTHLRLLDTHGTKSNGQLRLPDKVAPLRIHGQEIEGATYAIARMNAVLHDMADAEIRLGDTMRRPAFTLDDGSLRTFDVVAANPMWNQKFPASTFENDGYQRFGRGVPPSSSGDWGWLQHMLASLGPKGRMAVVLDTGAVSRGSGNVGSNKERDIRRKFVEDDLVEAVFLFADNLFYNTSAPAIVIVVNRNKDVPGEILLVNGSTQCSKGRPKNYLADEHIERIAECYECWHEVDGLSAVITNDDAAANDFNLSPSRYVSTGAESPVLPLDEAVVLLAEAEEERVAADAQLDAVLGKLGFEGWRDGV